MKSLSMSRISQGLLFLSILTDLVSGGQLLTKQFTELAPRTPPIFLAGPWQCAIYKKTASNDKNRLCFGIPIGSRGIMITNRKCVDGESVKNLFMTVQYKESETRGRTLLANFKVIKIIKNNPFKQFTKEFSDVAVLMYHPFPFEKKTVKVREINKEVKYESKVNIYFWATPNHHVREALKVHHIEGKLISYDKCEVQKPELKNIETYLFAKMNVPRMPEWKLQESRGSPVLNKDGDVIGLISDYTKDASGKIACLIITDTRNLNNEIISLAFKNK